MKIPQDKLVTTLEVAILFYGHRQAPYMFSQACFRAAAYDRRREIILLRYAKGMLLREIAEIDGRQKERAQQIIAAGLRILRHPAIRQTWNMLVQERPALATSQLAIDVYGLHSIRHRELLIIGQHWDLIDG